MVTCAQFKANYGSLGGVKIKTLGFMQVSQTSGIESSAVKAIHVYKK